MSDLVLTQGPPMELLMAIIKLSGPQSYVAASQVCKYWREAVTLLLSQKPNFEKDYDSKALRNAQAVLPLCTLDFANLTSLKVAANVDDDFVYHLCKNTRSSIATIVFHNCSGVIDAEAALVNLARAAPKLKVFTFDGCACLCSAAITAFAKKARNLEQCSMIMQKASDDSLHCGADQAALSALREHCLHLKFVNFQNHAKVTTEMLVGAGFGACRGCGLKETPLRGSQIDWNAARRTDTNLKVWLNFCAYYPGVMGAGVHEARKSWTDHGLTMSMSAAKLAENKDVIASFFKNHEGAVVHYMTVHSRYGFIAGPTYGDATVREQALYLD